MYICENCGKEHDGTYGTGRFCSSACSHVRHHNDTTKKKISAGVKEHNKKLYGNDYISKEEKRKHEKLINNEKFIDMVTLSDDMKFLEFPNIDFGKRYVVTKSGKIISTSRKREMSYILNSADTYKRVVLTDNNSKQHIILVHRIVAFNFIPNPNNYPIINHKDEDKSNNNVNNLEWCTVRYNNTYNDRHIKVGNKLRKSK